MELTRKQKIVTRKELNLTQFSNLSKIPGKIRFIRYVVLKNIIEESNLAVIISPLSIVITIIQSTSSSSISTGALLRTSEFLNCDS